MEYIEILEEKTKLLEIENRHLASRIKEYQKGVKLSVGEFVISSTKLIFSFETILSNALELNISCSIVFFKREAEVNTTAEVSETALQGKPDFLLFFWLFLKKNRTKKQTLTIATKIIIFFTFIINSF